MIIINVPAYADSVLISVWVVYLLVKGLEKIIWTNGKIKRQINAEPEIEGFYAYGNC